MIEPDFPFQKLFAVNFMSPDQEYGFKVQKGSFIRPPLFVARFSTDNPKSLMKDFGKKAKIYCLQVKQDYLLVTEYSKVSMLLS